ncbi:MAG: PD-(D/E)XK nuclease family protein [Candidatus Bathyarchaeia archaeon]
MEFRSMYGRLTVKQQRKLEMYIANESSLNKRLGDTENSELLRFNQSYIAASAVAEQFYCERKVELEHIHGRVETETKKMGSEGHETLQAGSIEVNREEILRRVFSGEPVVVHELPILMLYRGVILVGQPDAVLFKDGNPLVLFEYKFSGSPYPYRSYHAQARVYDRILDGAGFDTSDLFYAIAVASRESRGDESLFRKVIEAVNENGPAETSLTVGDAHVYLYEYNQPMAERDIDWALAYWRGTREIAPVDNPAKCRSCEYRDKCHLAD